MKTIASQLRLLPLALALLAVPAFAQRVAVPAAKLAQLSAQLPQRAANALVVLRDETAKLGLDTNADFVLMRGYSDEFGMVHARYRQTYGKIPVWGADVVVHQNLDGSYEPHTNALRPDVRVSTKPSLTVQQAQAAALADFKRATTVLKGGGAPAASGGQLYVYPITVLAPVDGVTNPAAADATKFAKRLQRTALAYQLRVDASGTAPMEYMVDAHSGAILASWDARRTDAAPGISQYNGTVTVQQLHDSDGRLKLIDRTRATRFGTDAWGGYKITNQQREWLTLVNDAPPIWGDGKNYVLGIDPENQKSSQTAGVDVAYGLAMTHDMYRNVFNWAGKDGKDGPLRADVHSFQGANAYYDPKCECLGFGDGYSATATIKMGNVTSLDVVGHELTHAVTRYTADLWYSGKSGGLNESTSDIMGTMATFYARGAKGIGNIIPAATGPWVIGAQLSSKPIRYMYKPSLDGRSLDAWSSDAYNSEVHNSSGIGNRAFYFLAQGATASGDTSTPLLPKGMSGIGNDNAAKIWFRGLTTYLVPLSDYVSARQAMIQAARDLYGANSSAEIAVWNAFHGVNVGPAYGTAPSCGAMAAQVLYAGQMVKSCSGAHALVMQASGDLQYLRLPSTVLWHSVTATPGSNASMQADGNLVVYAPGGVRALWSSDT